MTSREHKSNSRRDAASGNGPDDGVEQSMQASHSGSAAAAGHAAKQQLRNDKDLNKAQPDGGIAAEPEKTEHGKGE